MANYKFILPVTVVMTDDPVYGSISNGGGVQLELEADDFDEAKGKLTAIFADSGAVVSLLS